MKVAIIGAGPAGLAMAHELCKNGIAVSIYEKDKVVGGLAKSVWLWHARTELGPHFIGENMNPAAKAFMQEIFDSVKMHHYERLSRIHMNNSFYNYPPDGINIIKSIGLVACCKAAISFINRKRKSSNAEDVESFVKGTFGNYIFTTFFQEYTEKLWGKSCKEIDAIFFKNLIGFKGNSMMKKLRNMFTKKNTVTYKKSYYPDEGFSMLWEAMQQKIEANDGQFYFSVNIKGFTTEGKKVTGIQLADGSVEAYDYVVSTIPETILIRLLPQVPVPIFESLARINYRSLICVFLLLEHCYILEDNTVYLYSKQLKATRITNFNRFRNIDGNDIVMLEYWTSEKETVWQLTDDAIVEIAKKDLTVFSRRDNIVVKDTKIIRLRNAYEIPELGFQKIKTDIADFLQQFDGLVTAGRANQHNFNYGMGDAIADGYSKAGKIVAASKESLLVK
ncbi:FAD-dependent oxidoreductase [Ilyomonas limi]|uniref:FAD-dependent oxidoreductase n=1 Tax=Ilyomonas limi TaxID=2575867 RepID=A0A4U3L1U2_9BACT|nr:FAD-dependent oxidoreductase [Ilyomonas limi]TKK67466.1 FAD-dependent oxidoreductase [Ilyomonas limi]